ncbi:hypothetical protein WN55_01867 [Dufourea novaeangliae]|uniref:Uncharacterized protein n=1 Tax=Dufourea novaeangliae TaxID=178035 RepID=A0A154PGJ7_DUFNO|nr:hypothetical protein WN55_01867 [Dufourea novaeangliae]
MQSIRSSIPTRDISIVKRSTEGRYSLVSCQFGERGVHLVGERLVSVLVDAQFVWKTFKNLFELPLEFLDSLVGLKQSNQIKFVSKFKEDTQWNESTHFLFGYFQRFQAVTDNFKFFLQTDHSRFTRFDSVFGDFQLVFNEGQLSRYLVRFSVGVFSEQTSLLQLVRQLIHPLLILLCTVLQYFAHTEIISSGVQSLLGSLQVLLNQLHLTVQSSDLGFSLKLKITQSFVGPGPKVNWSNWSWSIRLTIFSRTYVSQSLLFLLQILVRLIQGPFIGREIALHLDQFLLQVADFLVDFVRAHIRLLGLALAGVSLVHRVVLLKLHRLHLLLDRVHGGDLFLLPASFVKLSSSLKSPIYFSRLTIY